MDGAAGMGVCFRVASVAGVAEPFKTRPFVWLGLWRAPQQLIVKLAVTAAAKHEFSRRELN